MKNYKSCPYCGANLDPQEHCECRGKIRVIKAERGEKNDTNASD